MALSGARSWPDFLRNLSRLARLIVGPMGVGRHAMARVWHWLCETVQWPMPGRWCHNPTKHAHLLYAASGFVHYAVRCANYVCNHMQASSFTKLVKQGCLLLQRLRPHAGHASGMQSKCCCMHFGGQSYSSSLFAVFLGSAVCHR